MREVVIYSDGACLGNPGPGGYAAVITEGNGRIEISGGFRKTTNNRMEILGAVAGLRSLRGGGPARVRLHTDSRLLVDTMTKGWIESWQRKNWRKSNNDKVLNKDLLMLLLKERAMHRVEFIWVPGHAGVPENERCDVLSKAAAGEAQLPPDVAYETGNFEDPALSERALLGGSPEADPRPGAGGSAPSLF